jgi:hypothetical protein
MEAGVRVTVLAAAAPVPVRVTFCGDPVALSATDRVADSAPAAAGLNSTDTVQLAYDPAGMKVPKGSVSWMDV